MKLDVERTGRPIIRLHDFDRADLARLHRRIVELSNLQQGVVSLHDEPYVEPLRGCRLTLRVGSVDRGIEPSVEANLFGWTKEPGAWDPYLCELSPASWAQVARGIELLLQLRFLCSEHVWLHRLWRDRGAVGWLLSPTGEW